MRKNTIVLNIALGLIVTLFGCSQNSNAQCPDARYNETILDCPWADASRATSGLTDFNKIKAVIDKKIPGVLSQIEKDSESRELLDLWSLSRNIDESHLSDGVLTVPANILATFNSILKVQYNSNFTVGHAGLTHTYGYLFSNLSTPYGYKRFRYVAGEIESGFGVSDGLFGGLSKHGTLLSNLTAFAAPIAFRDNENARMVYQNMIESRNVEIVPELVYYSRKKLKVKTLIETIKNDDFFLELRTNIVDFVNPNLRGTNQALLIYSMNFRPAGESSHARLVTVFPVDANFAKGIFNPAAMGDKVKIKLKYNAMLPVTVSPEDMVGTRAVRE